MVKRCVFFFLGPFEPLEIALYKGIKFCRLDEQSVKNVRGGLAACIGIEGHGSARAFVEDCARDHHETWRRSTITTCVEKI